MTNNLRLFSRWLPSLIWMMVIFYFSSRSTSGVISSEPIIRFLVFKSFHLGEYAVLGILLYFAAKKINNVILIAYVYACSDEIHQIFISGRNSKFSDTLIDLLGIIIGLIVIQLLKKLKIVYTKL